MHNLEVNRQSRPFLDKNPISWWLQARLPLHILEPFNSDYTCIERKWAAVTIGRSDSTLRAPSQRAISFDHGEEKSTIACIVYT
jgi:hypothetical protein